MKKMPCLFEREFHGRSAFTLLRTVTPGCEWVLAGEGIATRKWDGTACAVIEGKLYKRYDAKRGKAPPAGAIPCDKPDPVTGHHPHWIAVGDEPESKWHLHAWKEHGEKLPDGTYELIGPKFQTNPQCVDSHEFRRHGDVVLKLEDRSWDGLRAALENVPIEGIVFHHPDGRMCKIRRADYGFSWPWKSDLNYGNKVGAGSLAAEVLRK